MQNKSIHFLHPPSIKHSKAATTLIREASKCLKEPHIGRHLEKHFYVFGKYLSSTITTTEA